MKIQSVALSAALFLCGITPAVFAQEQDPFASYIRPTEKLTPEEEQKTFTLPPGFEIQLFASEPDIAKPLNMAFDARGRLWVTNTIEYPYAAPADRPGGDSLKILEDTDGDGRADKITTFAEGLNIPIGIYPYEDGAIVFSIPNIWRLRDTDGDGKADKREKLFGPMDYSQDTHGLNNSFRRGFDGWLYACHGFANSSTVSGTDGHEINMTWGSTYRMRLDGSRIEHFTWGQVNPFGMTFDELGNMFTSDCHSKPIYQMLRGAYYPSFSRPHDGMGFVPPMMEHDHGSTAIAGICVYDATNFPPDYHGNIFTGNVMTCRVNRDSLVYHGSTILAQEEPDFLSTSDPWFRPVDVQLGPDGALYVADFYNRVIGHYEVALDHPGRDRESGRIWRIVYTGKDAQPSVKPASLADASAEKLIETLGDDNFTQRMLAMNLLADRNQQQDTPLLRRSFQESKNGPIRSRALWILHRRGSLDETDLQSAAADTDPEVRVHSMKVLSETAMWSDNLQALALGGLHDEDPFVQRAAADALGQHPKYAYIRPLLDLLARIPQEDNHLRHAVRLALRSQLQLPQTLARLEDQLSGSERSELSSLCLSIHSPEAGVFLVRTVANQEGTAGDVAHYLEHAARYVPAEEIDQLVQLARRKFAGDIDQQLRLLNALRTGLQQRGVAVSDTIHEWSEQLTAELLESIRTEGPTWTYAPLPQHPKSENAFGVHNMPSADGDRNEPFIDSKLRGETATGILRSPVFTIPPQMSYYLSGHLGFPDKPAVRENFVRLRDAENHELLQEALPPRHDVAVQVKWDLQKSAGRRGYLEIVDGISLGGYAWLAAGRFEPPVVELPQLDPALLVGRQIAAANLVEQFGLQSFGPQISESVLSNNTDIGVRAAMSRALAALNPDSRLAALAPVIGNPAVPAPLRDQACQAVVHRDPAAVQQALAELIGVLARRPQEELAESLAVDSQGAESLLTLIEAGQAPPQLLQNQTVLQRLAALKSKDLEARIEELTADLPLVAEETGKELQSRKKSFAVAEGAVARGRVIFEKNCAVCHRVGQLGKVVGPQLDGVGNRGMDRVIEDMLDPNRNVDSAFRTTTLVLVNGKSVSGLLQREEGAVLVLIDNKGEEFRVPKKEVEERTISRTSLMPEGLTKGYSERDFNDLLAFLLNQQAAEKATP